MTDPDQEGLSGPPGWDAEWERAWTAEGADGLVPCRVVRIDKGGITVATKMGRRSGRVLGSAPLCKFLIVGSVPPRSRCSPQGERPETISQ